MTDDEKQRLDGAMSIDAAAIRAELADVREGPWEWYGNTKTNEVYLSTKGRGHVFVMDFVRWGMSSAQPRFQVELVGGDGYGVMRSVSEMAANNSPLGPTFDVPYRRQFTGIGHPDARFIARSRSLVPALLDEIDRLRALIERIDEALRVPAAEYVPAISDVFALIDGGK